jgi:hypothetical protein
VKLLIDGDAFPNILKPIIYRAIEKLSIETIIIANKWIFIGQSKHITNIVVSSGPDEADNSIVEMVKEGDLVITSDIPLADLVITKKAHSLDHRGKFFDADNIKQSLAIRNLMQDIRDSGEVTKGPSPISQKNAHEFANQLNRFFRRQKIS